MSGSFAFNFNLTLFFILCSSENRVMKYEFSSGMLFLSVEKRDICGYHRYCVANRENSITYVKFPCPAAGLRPPYCISYSFVFEDL